MTIRSGTGAFLDKEKLLVRRIRFGEQVESRRLVRELCAEIAADEGVMGGILRARLAELLVVASRGATRGGASVLRAQEIKIKALEGIYSNDPRLDLFTIIESSVDLLVQSVRLHGRSNPKAHSARLAAAYLRWNYHRPIRLEEVATEVRLSPFYLARLFKLEMGCTIHEYLTRLRIEKAKDLLQDPSFQVAEVARKVGFAYSGYFTKVFKQAEGITPTEFQRRYG